MKKKAICFLLFSFLQVLIYGSVECGLVDETGFYDLKGLEQPKTAPWQAVNKDWDYSLKFGICSRVNTCKVNSSYEVAWGGLFSKSGNCLDSLTMQGGYPDYTRQDGYDGRNWIIIHHSSLEKTCSFNRDLNYSLTITVKCNKSVPKQAVSPKVTNSTPCSYEVEMESKSACALFDWSVITDLIDPYLPIVAFVLAAFGVLVGVFGKAMWYIVIFLLFALAISIAFMVVFYYSFLSYQPSTWSVFFLFVLSIILGFIFAFYIAKYHAAGFILLGCWFGATFTFLLENFALRGVVAALLAFYMWRNKERTKGGIMGIGLFVIPFVSTLFVTPYTFWGCFIAMIALCGWISYSLKDLFITIATSFIGAYLVIRGVSLGIDGSFSEIKLISQIKKGEIDFTLELAIYSVCVIGLAIGFVYAQEFMKGDDGEDPLRNENEEELSDV